MKITLEDIKREHRYVSGVPATQEDAKSGKATFIISKDSKALDIPIPQYAWHTDEETKKRTLWIVIQAEENSGIRAYGAINPETGGAMSGLEREFELIGDTYPASLGM